jgi:hypothetical protein
MALSFKESKQLAAKKAATASVDTDVMTLALDDSEQVPVRAVYDDEDETFERSGNYTWFTDYSDDQWSYVDNNKDIQLDANQINITQEANSQVIPFEMPRYYDGIDLMQMTIQVHYLNANKEENYTSPINVSYSNTKIRFYWLVGNDATAKEGELQFEIMASGAVSVPNTDTTKNYLWRTRPNGRLNVLKSLTGKQMVDPTGNDWYTQFLATMSQKVGEAQTAANQAKQSAQDAKDAVASVDEKLSQFYKKDEVDGFVTMLRGEIAAVDGLANFNVKYDNDTRTLTFMNGADEITKITLNTDPSAEWVSMYNGIVDNKISTAVTPVQTELTEYKTSNDAAVQELKDSVGDLPETLKSSYYNKEATDALLDKKADKTTVDVLSSDVSGLKNTVGGIQTSVDLANADIAKIQETLKDFKPDENSGREYDITYEDSKLNLLENGTIKTTVIIEGGGGGGGGSTSTITIERIGESSIAVVKGDTAIVEFNFTSVDNSGEDTGDATGVWYVGNTKVATTTIYQGKNSFDITQYLHNGDNKIKLQVTDSVGSMGSKTWNINIVEFYLESIFDDSLVYSGEVTFRFTPYGNINKDVSFTLDGKKLGSVTTAVTGRQMTYAIPAQKHGAHLLEVTMTANINGKAVTSNTVYKDIMWAEEGNNTPIISCATKEFTAKQYSTTGIVYTVYNPVSSTAGVTLEVDGIKTSTLTVGRTAQTWSFKSSDIGTHTLTITCGATIKSITAKIEDLGITIEPVKTGLMLDFNPAGRSNADVNRLWSSGSNKMTVSDNFDWVNGGYQIDEDGDTYFCVKAGTTATISYKLFADDAKKSGKNFKLVFKTTNVRNYDATAVTCLNGGIGLNIQAQKVTLTSHQNSIDLPICENDFLEFEFNILPDKQFREMVLWCDGIPCRVELYDTSDSFTQAAPVGITIGSDDCDVIVYRMKSYGMNLTDDEILDNFIADAKNAEEMVSRYIRNDITDASGELTPDLLAEKCPDLRIIKISAPTFTTGKKNEVANTTIQQIYKNGRAKEDNWTATGSHKGQGTSSDHYGASARNIDINCKGGFTFGDDTTGDTYALTENSVPEKYFNIKVNVASSENANNSLLADEFNEFNPYVRQAKKDNPKVRDTMAFYPCVVFLQETDTTNATVFNDGQWHFYACGDIGNSKKNKDTMGMDPENHKEFIVEIDNNVDEQTRFLSGDFSQETWDGDHSFEFRYSNPACTEEEIEAGKQAWITAQNWVVNADDEEFKAHFKDHFDLDSAIFHYLFTERHTMVDNRAKNVFPHTSDLVHWDFCFDYDNDTAMGNDNEGGLTLTYGYEDTDTIGTKNVFNAADSKLWCKLRDLFPDEMAAMFRNRENALAWSATRILKKFEDYQDVKPEKLWIMDMRRKYFRTYEDPTINTTSYLPMMHGNKRHQRRQFQRYQEKYMASKYSGSAATSDDMTIRGYTPTNWTGVKPDGTFHITPYADTYVSVLYGSNPVKVRGKRGQTYTIECPVTAMNDTEVYIYNASIIQSIGDISGFYPGYVDFSHGVKLTELKVGSSVSGYKNTNMTDFAVGNNTLLEHLNLQNVPNLKKSIGLTGCTSLTEFYADGSGITGVSFASGGKIKIAHLPAIASLTAKNLNYLTDLTIEDYTNITTLTVEKCATIDLKDILGKCTNLNRVRITGIDWELADTSLLNRLYAMSGLDENGYNTDNSVVEGKVHVPIIREREKLLYTERWPDLEITYNTMINQYAWKFVNKDGTVLDIQYIDKGERAVDPVTRAENPIPTPTFPSTISTVFTFSGWDTEFIPVFGNQTVTAVYDESVREYTVRYMNRGAIVQQSTAPYGSMVLYDGETPTYTTEESAYKYYLFSGWDKGGYVNGDKDINAVYDVCEYVSGYFNGKTLGDLRPVEIYAMNKVGVEQTVVSDKDAITIQMGNDFSFNDVEEKVLFNEPKIFTGKNYVDTGIQLLSEDRSWVIALDYRFDVDSPANSTIAQCFQTNGMNGFRFWVNNGSKVSWGTESASGVAMGVRDMVVLRHTKGDNNISIYSASTTASDISYVQLVRTRITQTHANLVFGCARADDGAYERYAKGTIYWGKLWYTDLGDAACRKLAAWTHQDFTFEACGFKQYYLNDDSNKRCSITFIQKGLLGQKMALSTTSSSTGGWANTTVRTFLNSRILNALPIGWQQIIKEVKVGSTIGDKSSEVVTTGSYFYIPSVSELSPSMNIEPYIYEGSAISFMTDNESRICNDENGNPAAYWTRSPNVQYASYFWSIQETGEQYGFIGVTSELCIRLMFSV